MLHQHRALDIRRFPRVLLPALLPVLLLAASTGTATARSQGEIDRILADLRAAGIADDAALSADGLSLDAGFGQLRFARGVLFPVSAVDGQVRELVFLGEALLTIDPPDAIEAQQLSLFTGDTRVVETVYATVISLALDEASAAILSRPTATTDPAQLSRARRLLSEWRASAERRILGVEGALVADVLGDQAGRGYFAAWLDGKSLGQLLYVVDPRATEQVTFGRFEPVELSKKERKQVARGLAREQRGGRLLGLRLDDLGQFDNWISASLQRDGTPAPGTPGYEARHYEIEVEIDRDLEVSGRARIEIEAGPGAGLLVPVQAGELLRIDSIEDGAGTPLPFMRERVLAQVFLDEPQPSGEIFELQVRFGGTLIEEVKDGRGQKALLLPSTLGWYPHVGEQNLATYDVLLTWPKKYELHAAGRQVDQGIEGDHRFVRCRLSEPSKGFSFQLGKFKTLQKRFGNTTITLARDQWSWDLIDRPRVLLDWIGDAYTYLEQTFGALDSGPLTVVTNPRLFSQALPGLISLSSLMVSDDGLSAALGKQDPRTIIAHELSHLWWGHRVSWHSYRDQWLSEALANFSSGLYARERLGLRTQVWKGPFDAWSSELLERAESGHRVESLGPVVLGARLASSLSDSAYHSIVYTKGGLVLQMLADLVEEPSFIAILRWLAGPEGRRVLSTEELLQITSETTGVALEAFASKLIYGVEVPRADYSYEVVPAGDGFRLRGEVELLPSVDRTYRVVELPSGRLDVRREWRWLSEVPEQLRMVVPLEVYMPDPDPDADRDGRGKGSAEAAPIQRLGQLLIDGRQAIFDLGIAVAPLEVRISGRSRALILATAKDDESSAAWNVRAQRALASGAVGEASKLYRQALTEEPDDDGTRYRLGLTRLALVHLLLDGGASGEVAALLEETRTDFRKLAEPLRGWLRKEIDEVDSRLALERGTPADVVKRLRRRALDRQATIDPEALLLLAVAAREIGDGELLERALERLRPRRGDVADLWRLDR